MKHDGPTVTRRTLDGKQMSFNDRAGSSGLSKICSELRLPAAVQAMDSQGHGNNRDESRELPVADTSLGGPW